MAERHMRLDAVRPGGLKRVAVGRYAICLARTQEGGVYAIDDECTHEGYSLSEGELIGFEIECPMHGSRFDVRTGRPTCLPAETAARVYPVRVENDEIYLCPLPDTASGAPPGSHKPQGPAADESRHQ
jgi:3-phenylpropionate/trans-cinnamate dioxygenase ferredoxin subunit